MTEFIVRALNKNTWPDFARLVEKHNAVWGGCWCMGFHEKGDGWNKSAALNREEKECRVREVRAHAVGWCQFGPSNEPPRIKHKREYLKELTILPDWRITCFFVDRDYRHKGVAFIALEGALNEIARLGGGIVESYPENVAGRSTSGSFLYNSTVSIFERLGFQRIRRLGKNHWVGDKGYCRLAIGKASMFLLSVQMQLPRMCSG